MRIAYTRPAPFPHLEAIVESASDSDAISQLSGAPAVTVSEATRRLRQLPCLLGMGSRALNISSLLKGLGACRQLPEVGGDPAGRAKKEHLEWVDWIPRASSEARVRPLTLRHLGV